MLRAMIYMHIMPIIYYNCPFQRAILADNILLYDGDDDNDEDDDDVIPRKQQ